MDGPAANAEASHRTKGLVRLTMACNERCPFCNVPAEDYLRPTPTAEETDAMVEAFVASGERTMTVSGGEPTLLRRRLLRTITAARTRGVPFVELQTNAVLIDAAYATALAEAGLTSAFVSLLSDEPALHDALAGLDGAFPRCLAGIDALLDAGVRVTLNPVTAASTQARLPAYVDFVAARLPRVRSISLSAVQPHGRARAHLELLPDYAVLGPAVRAARQRAELHGIELLNPYCGLPACVGWEDGLAACVEAIEAEARAGAPPGVDNRGDKRHGEPCRACVLRGRCGGAWHAYWEVRGGSGIRAPAELVGPWAGAETGAEAGAETGAEAGAETGGQAGGEPVFDTLEGAAQADTIGAWWLNVDGFSRADADAALAARVPGVAVVIADGETGNAAALAGLHRLARRRTALAPQEQPAVWLGVRFPTAAGAGRAVEFAAALGVDRVVLLAGADTDETGAGANVKAELPGLAAHLAAKWRVDVRVGAATPEHT